jgi:hypothetical protein
LLYKSKSYFCCLDITDNSTVKSMWEYGMAMK